MHYVLLASLLLAFPAFASEKCQRVEYAELQDMSTDEQTVYFCKVQSSHWYNALLVDNIRKVYKGNETFMDQRKRDELREDLTALEACKAALDSVSRLLRRKNIDPDGIQCEKGLPKKPQG